MPNFDARPVSGVTVRPWNDHRANPLPAHPHLAFYGTVGVPICVSATVNGAEGPADSALDGELFTAQIMESPGPLAVVTTADPGYSSTQRFTPRNAGHHSILFARSGGGAMAFMFEVE